MERGGEQIGAYRLVKPIGSGGMGQVWLAEHVMLGRRAAIKLLHVEYSARDEIVTRFFNEARAATAISDPGIVQIYDYGHHSDGSAYIVMELLDGEPLDKRLGRLGTLPAADAVRIMRQVASSVGAAHQCGIIHRDLKPENIFLARDPEVNGGERAKILDFGIAKLIGDARVKTQTSAVMGTPVYMSPEQCRGAGLVDQRADVYSLGCILYVLLAGRPPFDAEGIGEIIAMHLREPAPRISSHARGIPAALDALIARCLEKDPAQRFPSAAELAAALAALESQPNIAVASAPTIVRPPSTSTPTTLSSLAMSLTPSPRGRTALWIASSVAALTMIIVVVLIGSRSSTAAHTRPVVDAARSDAPPSDAAPLDAPPVDAPPLDAPPLDARAPDAAPPSATPARPPVHHTTATSPTPGNAPPKKLDGDGVPSVR